MIRIRQRGNFKKTETFLKKSLGTDYIKILDHFGQLGVKALAAGTPKDTGTTAASWYYEIIQNGNGISVIWKNRNVQNGLNIALLLQYGHGTRNGGYVEGIDYVNPALKPIFEELAKSAWKEVTQSGTSY